MWLIRIWHIVTEPVEKATSWLDGQGDEPAWPDRKPKTHVCDGCGKARPLDAFAVVDSVMAGQYVPLVRCDECRTVKPSTTPFDAREKT